MTRPRSGWEHKPALSEGGGDGVLLMGFVGLYCSAGGVVSITEVLGGSRPTSDGSATRAWCLRGAAAPGTHLEGPRMPCSVPGSKGVARPAVPDQPVTRGAKGWGACEDSSTRSLGRKPATGGEAARAWCPGRAGRQSGAAPGPGKGLRG